MTKWECIESGYFFEGVKPPDKCLGCGTVCTYADVTCYRPDCGGLANCDPMVMDIIAQRVGLAARFRPTSPTSVAKTTERVFVEKISKTDLFQGLNDSEIKQVLGSGQVRVFDPGDIVFKAGDAAVHIYIVEEGELDVQNQEKQTVCTALAGDVIGWSTLLLPYKRSTSAISATKAHVAILDQAELQEFCEKNTSIGYKITRNAGRLIATRMSTPSLAST